MDSVLNWESLFLGLGWLLLTLLSLLVPIAMLGAAIWAARRLPRVIGGALILGSSVTLLSAIASTVVFSPMGMSWIDLGAAYFSYISVGLQVVGTLGGLLFAGGFVALALWLPAREN